MTSSSYTTAPATPGYIGIFQADAELSEAETVARLNQMEVDNAGLLALLREIDYADPARAEKLLSHAREQEHPGRELMARTLEEVVSLRLQLASADEHVGALVGAGEAALPELWNIGRGYIPAYVALKEAVSLARAWLRRGAK